MTRLRFKPVLRCSIFKCSFEVGKIPPPVISVIKFHNILHNSLAQRAVFANRMKVMGWLVTVCSETLPFTLRLLMINIVILFTTYSKSFQWCCEGSSPFSHIIGIVGSPNTAAKPLSCFSTYSLSYIIEKIPAVYECA